MQRKKVWSLLCALLCIMLLMAACGSEEAQTQDVQEAPGEDATVDVPAGQGIRMAVSGNPNIDPATGSNWVAVYCYINIYDSLVMYDEEGNLIPLLAESWEMAEDGLSYTFKLKEGVKFHDGSELTASDVVFSFNRMMTINQGFTYMFKNCVASVEALDEYTVKFNLTQTVGAFLDRLCRLYILNEDLVMANLDMENSTYNYGEFGDYGRSYLLEKDAGSGPYMVTELSQQNHVQAEKFDDYHIPFAENAPAYIRIINNTEATTVRTMLASRELELSDNWQTTESYEALAKIDGVTVTNYSNSSTQMISFNCSLEPTDDVYVRKALACLVDYDAVVNNIFPGSVRAVGPVNAATPGANSANREYPYNYDLEQAKAYLAQSKYADRLDEISIEFFVNSTVPSQEKLALMIQAAAQQVGLEITVTSAPYSTWSERVTSSESTANMSTASQAPYYYDAGASFEAHFTDENQGTTTNTHWISEPTLNQQIIDAVGIIDQTERYAAYAEIEQKILDECYAIFVADITEKVAYQSDYVYWPAAEYFAETGELRYNELGYHYWFHDFGIIQ